MLGKIYLVATPIGNLSDMSFRAIEVLKFVDLIAAEDTRNSIKLLNHFDIKKSLISYHEYNKIDRAYEIIEQCKQGKNIALITDAGMPAISDPGEDLVRIAYEEGVEVSIIPGACACVSALAISGQKTRRFCFEGFLPTEKKERQYILDSLKNETRTIILYEAPHRLEKTFLDLSKVIEGDRKLSIIREITKRYEEVAVFTLSQAIEAFDSDNEDSINIRGEYVIVISGRSIKDIIEDNRKTWDNISIQEHMEIYQNHGIERKEAMKLVAKDRGLSKRDIYKELL